MTESRGQRGAAPFFKHVLQTIGRQLRVALFAVMVLLATSRTAHAHLVTSGVGPFYDGMAHFFVSPEDLLVVVALSLLGGISGKRVARWVAVALPLAWLLGMLVGTKFPAASGSAPAIVAMTLLLSGLLVCASPQVSLRAILPLVAAIGAVHGWLNGEALASTETSLLAGLGIVSAATVLGLLLSAASVSLTASWQRVAVRVAGSWIAAIGLLAIAWQFRTIPS